MAELLPRLEAGGRVALVSDAGLPGISDPVARLVRAARAAGVEVTVLPGASAVETALVTSGLAESRYAFLGFLPRRAAELEQLWQELERWPWPVVAFESPQRLPKSLRSLAAFEAERQVAVCRELTKRFEEVVHGAAAEVAERFDDRFRRMWRFYLLSCAGAFRVRSMQVYQILLAKESAARKPQAPTPLRSG